MRVRPREASIINKADVPQPGEHYGVPVKPYRHQNKRPARDDTYMLDGETHTFDGSCHTDCPNVR